MTNSDLVEKFWNLFSEQKVREYNLDAFYSSPIPYPHSTSWYVKDPTGNEIEVAIWQNNEVKFL